MITPKQIAKNYIAELKKPNVRKEDGTWDYPPSKKDMERLTSTATELAPSEQGHPDKATMDSAALSSEVERPSPAWWRAPLAVGTVAALMSGVILIPTNAAPQHPNITRLVQHK